MKALGQRTAVLLFASVALLAAAVTAAYSLRGRATRRDARRVQLDQCLEEIGSAMFGFPLIAPRKKEVWYVYRQPDSDELRIHNFIDGKVTVLPLPGTTPQQGFTWSPDGRYLPMKTEARRYRPSPGREAVKPQRLFVYDGDKSKLIPVTNQEMVIGNYAVWLDNTSFLYSASTLASPKLTPKAYHARLDNGLLHQQQIELPGDVLDALSGPRKLVAACNPTLLVFSEGDTVNLLDLRSGSVSRIAALSDGSFSGFNWLNWSPESQRLLFCATKSGENYRNLFAYDQVQASVARLSTVHSYNGQWLQGGQGYAYVANSNGNFSVWVHDDAKGTKVNLFTNGYVDRCVASAGGDYLVALATTNGEPRGLWKYDLATKALSCLEPGNTVPFKHARISEARSLSVRSSDGLTIPIYLFPPTDPDSGQKHPLVAYLPPITGPAHRGYEIRPQLLANLGFYYAGINYRGCDGYGRLYSTQWDEDKAAEDVFGAIQALRQQFPVDAQRVFTVSVSASSIVLQRLMRKYPGTIRASVFLEPAGWEPEDLLEARPLPRLFVSIGRNDAGIEFVQKLQQWTKSHAVPAQFLYISNYGHFAQDIRKREVEERALAQFLLKNL